MSSALYTWTAFYEELADKLLLFRNNRETLINKLQTVYETIGIKLALRNF